MSRKCTATKKSGKKCTNNALPGKRKCGIHSKHRKTGAVSNAYLPRDKSIVLDVIESICKEIQITPQITSNGKIQTPILNVTLPSAIRSMYSPPLPRILTLSNEFLEDDDEELYYDLNTTPNQRITPSGISLLKKMASWWLAEKKKEKKNKKVIVRIRGGIQGGNDVGYRDILDSGNHKYMYILNVHGIYDLMIDFHTLGVTLSLIVKAAKQTPFVLKNLWKSSK